MIVALEADVEALIRGDAPGRALAPGDEVEAEVIEVDVAKMRVSLAWAHTSVG